MTFPYAQSNAESRQRLQTLVHKLSDADLARTTEYGWTVAALLAHLAFWDHRMSVILKRWQAEGLDASEIDSTAVNDALKVLCHALEPRRAANLALTAAQQIDSELEALSADYVQQLEAHAQATGTQFRLHRSLHRMSHVNDIEALLK